MEQLLKQFGLNWTLLLAQIINFGLLVFVFYRFAYKPILKILDNRRDKIENSLKQVKLIEERSKQLDQEITDKLAASEKKASELIKKAKNIGEKTRQEILGKAAEEVTAMINKAKSDIEQEKTKMMADIKNYIVKTSLLIIEKILSDKLPPQTKEELVLDSIKEIRG